GGRGGWAGGGRVGFGGARFSPAGRPAAGSAVAPRALARHDAASLGIFGTGVQARFHVQTVRLVRSLQKVLVHGTSTEKETAFADWVQQECGLAAEPASADETSAADIVAACTTSATPVVLADHVQPGA